MPTAASGSILKDTSLSWTPRSPKVEEGTAAVFDHSSGGADVPSPHRQTAVSMSETPDHPRYCPNNHQNTMIPMLAHTADPSHASTPPPWGRNIVATVPRSVLWRIEENLLLKLAVRRLQSEELQTHRRVTAEDDVEGGAVNDWEMTLFAPLGPDHAEGHHQQHNHPSIAVSFAAEHMIINTPQSPAFKSNSKSVGDLTVATETESHLISTDAEESHVAVGDFDADDGFLPVEVEWEDPREVLSCPRVLTPSMMQYLHDHGIPESLQGNRWERCFAIGRDGDSFCSFLNRCAPYKHSLIVIQTTEGHILGGFAARSWQGQEGYGKRQAYYGTGQSFLFCSHAGACPEVAVPSETTAELQIFKWTGTNDYCQICDVEEAKVAMGGGGNFGLIVEDGFWRGQTGFCGTYANPPLVPSGFFEVAAFEVYGLIPLFQSFHAAHPQAAPLGSTMS